MRQKLPTVLAVTALVVAVFGATPLGHAAGNVVKRALFANNAGKVNGIKAATTPQPNQLVPLGPDAKFPSSVIPQASTGGGGGGTSTPGPNSVGSDQVVDGSLTGADIKDGSITGAKLADKTVTAKQIDLSTLPVQLKSDSVRIDAPAMAFGTTRSWDIGKYITLDANCYTTPDGTHHLKEMLLNNAPGPGEARGSDLVAGLFNQAGPAIPLYVNAVIGSGQEQLLTSNADPSTTYGEGTSNVATFIWRDDSGETITGTYESILFPNYCELVGTLTRTT